MTNFNNKFIYIYEMTNVLIITSFVHAIISGLEYRSVITHRSR